jgi:predicted Zn-dependent protease
MAMDLSTLRKLVSLDPNDPLSRFALGKKLFETASSNADLTEAAEHLTFANERAPDHLATYHILGQTLIKLGRTADARRVLEEGIRRTVNVGEGMGRDLGPAMQGLLASL